MIINTFESSVYSEELFTVSESEHDEVMQMMAADDFAGYEDFSRELESENFVVVNGSVQHKPEPKSQGRLKGFEL